MGKTYYIVLAVALVTIVGCEHKMPHYKSDQRVEYDEWYSFKEKSSSSIVRSDIIPKESTYEVNKKYIQDAIHALRTVSCVELSNTDGSKYAGVSIVTKNKIILARAVAFVPETGYFVCAFKDKSLFIHHASMGSEKKMRKYPVIVLLDNKPKCVYSTCDIME